MAATIGVATVTCASAMIVGAPAPASAAGGTWPVIALAPLNPGDTTVVYDIDDNGVSVGQSGTTPVRWSASGQPLALQMLGCTSGKATAISRGGDEIVGIAQCGGQSVAIHWHGLDQRILAANFEPHAVDDAGNIGGRVLTAPGSAYGHAAIIVGDHSPQGLSDAGAMDSQVNAITDSHLAVGQATFRTGSLTVHGYAVGWYAQYTFPMVPSSQFQYQSKALAATDSGYTLVEVDTSNGPSGEVITPKGQTVPLVGNVPGTTSPGPYGTDMGVDISNNGFVVGQRFTPSNVPPTENTTPFLYVYGRGVSLYDLRAPTTIDLTIPAAINDSAWIVGNGTSHDTAWLMHPPS